MTAANRPAGQQGVSPTYVSVKAFGDFVIAATCLRGVGEGLRRPRLTVPGYLEDLAQVVAMDVQTARLPLRRSGIPALFDVKSAGPVRASLSAVDLFAGLATLPPIENEAMVFDRVGIRERAISLFRPIAALPQAANIYSAYQASLLEFGFHTETGERPGRNGAGNKVGIFPSSRIEQKSIPIELLAGLLDRFQRIGVDAEINLLDGEREDIRGSGLPYVALSRTFDTLAGAVSACRCVISADSLPAHLAENFGLPSFILTPKPNSYWLPASSFRGGAWSEFGNADAIASAVRFTEEN